MLSRSQEREIAFQLVFAHFFDQTQNETDLLKLVEKQTQYGWEIFLKIKDNLNSYEKQIVPHLRGWTFDRISAIDKSILLVALQEINTSEDVPFKVAVDEAINLSKKFGTKESGSFINAILDKLKK